MFKYLKGQNSPQTSPEKPEKPVPEVSNKNTQPPELAEEEILELSEVFHLLGDPGRLKIMLMLRRQQICVGDLAHRMNQSASLVSHHLRLLKTAGLIRSRRDGRQIYYTITEDLRLQEVLNDIAGHIKKSLEDAL